MVYQVTVAKLLVYAEFHPCQIPALQLTGNEKQDLFRRQLKQDLCSFEGNAQGLRMAHRLLKLNLTYAQIGSILKYTRGAYDLEPIPLSLII